MKDKGIWLWGFAIFIFGTIFLLITDVRIGAGVLILICGLTTMMEAEHGFHKSVKRR